MTRKAAWCGLSFLAGTLLFCGLGESFLPLVLAAAAFTGLGLLALGRYRVYAAAVGCSVLCGLLCGRVYERIRVEPALELDGREITLEGEVTECRDLGSDRWQLVIDGEADDTSVKMLVYSERPFEPYSIVRATGTAERLTDSSAFPSATYYRPKGIYLSADTGVIEATGEYGSPIMRGVTALRDYTAKCITASMGAEEAAFVTALVCGDRSELDDAAKTRLYRAGVGHILAMSGTHMMTVGFFFYLLFFNILRTKKLSSGLLVPVVLAFMAFGGLSPSIVRAGIMIILVSTSQIMGRRTDILSSLGICAVVMCGTDPYVCLSQSFVCSFAACAAAGCLAPKLTIMLRERKYLRLITVPLAVSAVVSVTMMPVSALWFDEFSLISPVSNLLIVPLCTAALSLTLPAMMLGGAIVPAQLLLKLAGLAVKLALRLTDFFSSLGFASVGCSRYVLLLIGAAVIAGAFIFAVRHRRPRIFASCTAGVFVILWTVQSLFGLFDRSTVRVKLFPGRGSCAVISCGGSCSAVDMGSKGTASYSVQQYLSRNGIRRCDTAFIADGSGASVYTGGLFPGFNDVRTDLGYYSEAFTEGMTADFKTYSVTRTAKGYTISAGGREYTLDRSGLTDPAGNLIAEGEIILT
ncbi:MAG: ComEC/Rec2 family competence protein [Ruminococcus sp.]|nr:ComEC/Rec2 family competence protein [Ruminococcus sp.]